jgi:hypothetical protein
MMPGPRAQCGSNAKGVVAHARLRREREPRGHAEALFCAEPGVITWERWVHANGASTVADDLIDADEACELLEVERDRLAAMIDEGMLTPDH